MYTVTVPELLLQQLLELLKVMKDPTIKKNQDMCTCTLGMTGIPHQQPILLRHHFYHHHYQVEALDA